MFQSQYFARNYAMSQVGAPARFAEILKEEDRAKQKFLCFMLFVGTIAALATNVADAIRPFIG